MQIFLMTITGKTYTLDVEVSDTAEALKDKICRGFLPHHQQIVFGGKILQADILWEITKIKRTRLYIWYSEALEHKA